MLRAKNEFTRLLVSNFRDCFRFYRDVLGLEPGFGSEDDSNADFAIGPSYLMRPTVYADGGLERAWRTSILPLLEELHYGDSVDVPGRYGLAALRRGLPASAAALTPAPDESSPYVGTDPP